MTTELEMLVLSALWTLLLAVLSGLPLILSAGLPYAAGNRDEPFALQGWGDRLGRAHRNMLENLAPFAALVLVAQALGISNDTTALGAHLFFWGRVAHAIVYVAGIPYLRTAVYAVSVAGMLVIATAIL